MERFSPIRTPIWVFCNTGRGESLFMPDKHSCLLHSMDTSFLSILILISKFCSDTDLQHETLLLNMVSSRFVERRKQWNVYIRTRHNITVSLMINNQRHLYNCKLCSISFEFVTYNFSYRATWLHKFQPLLNDSISVLKLFKYRRSISIMSGTLYERGFLVSWGLVHPIWNQNHEFK